MKVSGKGSQGRRARLQGSPEGGKGTSHADIWGNIISGRENIKCKGDLSPCDPVFQSQDSRGKGPRAPAGPTPRGPRLPVGGADHLQAPWGGLSPQLGPTGQSPLETPPMLGSIGPSKDLGGEAGPAYPRSCPRRTSALDVSMAVCPKGAAGKPISDPRGRHRGKV